MVFGFLKKFHKETMQTINEEWDNKENPLNLHKQAFEFLQKEFGAFQFLNLNSDSIKDREEIAIQICKDGGSVYDICWEYYFRREITFSSIGNELIDNRKILIYNSCKQYYEDKKFSLTTTYEQLEDVIDGFEEKIPPEFPFTKFRS
jgi:hypothetical protein